MHQYAKRLCGFALAGTSAISAEAIAAEVHQVAAPPAPNASVAAPPNGVDGVLRVEPLAMHHIAPSETLAKLSAMRVCPLLEQIGG
jgi:hypothetical protein